MGRDAGERAAREIAAKLGRELGAEAGDVAGLNAGGVAAVQVRLRKRQLKWCHLNFNLN